ncbi:hypothetical protein TNCT_143701 [Trichonephila clavata]|uniref:Uncharacterized protein n=1 Tax=Trichonephila clavata TaxID=2740835 RepID=A0A8X6G155_TRICU|nr:hypothetical protein TNCT_143701 [Trichonephila clavata]
MESPPNKPEAGCNHMAPQDVPSRYLPFLEAGFWTGATPLSPFLMGRDIPPFWPVPWLPHLWSASAPTQNPKQDSGRPLLTSSSTTSPSPDVSRQIPNGSSGRVDTVTPAFRSPSLSNSPVMNGPSGLNGHRNFVDPLIALTSMEGIDGPPKNNAVGLRPAEKTIPWSRSVLAVVAPHVQIPGAINGSIKKDRTHDTITGYATSHCDAWLIQLCSHNDMWTFICPVPKVTSVEETRHFKTGFSFPRVFREHVWLFSQLIAHYLTKL